MKTHQLEIHDIEGKVMFVNLSQPHQFYLLQTHKEHVHVQHADQL